MVPKEFEEMEEETAAVLPEKKIFSLEILHIIKEAQQQHGLRHADYQRYRGYCTRRLRRLRKVLKLPQGDRRHFKRKDVIPAVVTDDKFLQIPLTLAERAWAYAMQLRIESNTEPRKKFHLVSRLRKAGAYALELQQLIENIECDARTKLEVEAYVAWIQGSIHFELQAWKPAMDNFSKAQVVYENLAAALPEADRLIYNARVEELTPNLRYCAYNIGDKTAIDDLMQMRGKLSGDILSNLDSLITQSREKQVSAEEVFWRGKTCGTAPPKVSALLITDSKLNATLNKATTHQEKIEILEGHLIDCKDAIAALREEFKGELKTKEGEKEGPQQLLAYLQYIKLSRTLERNLILIKIGEESEKTKPQEIVRLYETVLHNLVEMTQLQDDDEFQSEHDARTKGYRAFRCYFMAKSLANAHKWREAMALYQRSLQHVKDALEQKNFLPGELKTALIDLEKKIQGSQCAAHAHSILEDQEDDANQGKQVKTKKFLEERLHEYFEDPSLSGKQPNICKIPPSMEPVPCKPLFFDIAFNKIEFPDLSDKIQTSKKNEKGGISGFVKGIWGWGS